MFRVIDFVALKKIKYFSLFSSIFILLLIILLGFFIYYTGGTTSFVHLMYIPILLAVFIFGIKAGIIASFIAGFILGPFMPMVVSQGIMQESRSWIFRIFMFIIIVFVVGILLKYIKKNNDLEKARAFQDIITGYPNGNKFKEDFNEIIYKQKNNIVSFILFELKNRDMISQYINHDTSQKTFLQLIKIADEFFGANNIYTVSANMFLIVIPGSDEIYTYELANDFYIITKTPMYINSLPISVIIKAAIVNYPYHCSDVNSIILKLEKALSQVSQTQKNITIYDDKLEEERSKYYNTLVSLYHSLKNDMFALAYQPKISLDDGRVIGVEALLRIKGDDYKNISIGELINIAEDAGFINEITKWVINSSIKQIKEWQEDGLDICVSINLSSIDLNDGSIVEFTSNCLKEYKVDSSFLEFELTERSIIEDEERVYAVLHNLKKVGIKVSIDDYGSGYNSLVYLVNDAFPYDYLKIDKIFIDNISKKQNHLLVSGIVETAQALGIKVVAEGVESQDQVNILREMGCDIIQGYFYSKPLPPMELNSFMINKLSNTNV